MTFCRREANMGLLGVIVRIFGKKLEYLKQEFQRKKLSGILEKYTG